MVNIIVTQFIGEKFKAQGCYAVGLKSYSSSRWNSGLNRGVLAMIVLKDLHAVKQVSAVLGKELLNTTPSKKNILQCHPIHPLFLPICYRWSKTFI